MKLLRLQLYYVPVHNHRKVSVCYSIIAWLTWNRCKLWLSSFGSSISFSSSSWTWQTRTYLMDKHVYLMFVSHQPTSKPAQPTSVFSLWPRQRKKGRRKEKEEIQYSWLNADCSRHKGRTGPSLVLGAAFDDRKDCGVGKTTRCGVRKAREIWWLEMLFLGNKAGSEYALH